MFISLIHVVLKLSGDMMATPGHQGFSVSEDYASPCIPDSLYTLLRIIVGGQEALEDDSGEKDEDCVGSKVLIIEQVVVYCVSGSSKWTAKHVDLANTLHQAKR